jgi:hypothetical protein
MNYALKMLHSDNTVSISQFYDWYEAISLLMRTTSTITDYKSAEIIDNLEKTVISMRIVK